MQYQYMTYVSTSYLLGLLGVGGIYFWVKWQKKQTQRFLAQWFKQKNE